MDIKIRSTAGQHELRGVSPSTTLSALKESISTLTGLVPARALLLKVGFPPSVISGESDTPIATLIPKKAILTVSLTDLAEDFQREKIGAGTFPFDLMLEDVKTLLVFDHFDPLTRIMFAFTNRKHLAFVRSHRRFSKIRLASPRQSRREVDLGSDPDLGFYLGSIGSRTILDFVDDNKWRFDFFTVVDAALESGQGDLFSTFQWDKNQAGRTSPRYRSYVYWISPGRAGHLVGKSGSRGLLELLRMKRLEIDEDILLDGAITSGRIEWVDFVLPPIDSLKTLTSFKLVTYKSTIRKAASIAVSLGYIHILDWILRNRGLQLRQPKPKPLPEGTLDTTNATPPFALMFGIAKPGPLRLYLRYIEEKGLEIDFVRLFQYLVVSDLNGLSLVLLQTQLKAIDKHLADLEGLKRLIRRAISFGSVNTALYLTELRPPLALVRNHSNRLHLSDPNEDPAQDEEGQMAERPQAKLRRTQGNELAGSTVDFFGDIQY